MKYSPKSGGKKVTVSALLLLTAAVICYVIPSVEGAADIVPAWAVQTVGVILAVAGIFILVRYRFITFTYVVSLRESGVDPDLCEAYEGECDVTRIPPELLDFTVYKAQGRRPAAAECIFSLGDLERTETYPEKRGIARAVKEELGADEYYDYTATPFPRGVTVLLFADGGRKIAVAVEFDEKTAEVFHAVSGKR